MKAEDLNTEGCIQLVNAIVTRAKLDYMRTKPGTDARRAVENFFTDGMFDKLTGLDGEEALALLRSNYYKQKRIKIKRI